MGRGVLGGRKKFLFLGSLPVEHEPEHEDEHDGIVFLSRRALILSSLQLFMCRHENRCCLLRGA